MDFSITSSQALYRDRFGSHFDTLLHSHEDMVLPTGPGISEWYGANQVDPFNCCHRTGVCVGGVIGFCTGVYLCKLHRVTKNMLGGHMNFLNKIKIGYWPIFYKVVGRREEGMFVIRPFLIKKKPKYFLILNTRSWSEYIDCNIESHVVI